MTHHHLLLALQEKLLKGGFFHQQGTSMHLAINYHVALLSDMSVIHLGGDIGQSAF